MAVSLCSCSTSYAPLDQNQNATYVEGVPGGTVVETYDLRATITDIDPGARKVTFLTRNGKKMTVKCGPEVVNFGQLRIGDAVDATMTSEMTIAMADAANPGELKSTSLVALSPKGGKPGGLFAETQQYTATITSLNLKRRQATLRFPDGNTRTFNIRKDVDLTQRRVGEEVVFKVAVAMAIDVRKP